MKSFVAIILTVVALAAAEPPQFRWSTRQTAPLESEPYSARGWRPSGSGFNFPLRSSPQQTYGPPQPAPSYGPPPQQQPTTETPATTEAATEEATVDESQAENLRIKSSANQKSAKTSQQAVPYFVIVPQSENLVYAIQKSAPFAAFPSARVVAAPLKAVPISSLSSASIFTPYSASLVQIYQ